MRPAQTPTRTSHSAGQEESQDREAQEVSDRVDADEIQGQGAKPGTRNQAEDAQEHYINRDGVLKPAPRDLIALRGRTACQEVTFTGQIALKAAVLAS